MDTALSQKNTLHTDRLRLTPSNLDWFSENKGDFLFLLSFSSLLLVFSKMFPVQQALY